ncbi:3-dehydroquinate synthase [Legionella israelensis]|uniref:3-dehydroquinate synthase n=1 Tax=Legionella israelensis TaxID=454 RepID=A0A0W0VU47_9GAMM|nr:3-dehydroquinate synthase [Legionella israelensis]KTD23719.1 3-dehydroquinate synthase [Legionella israelensis]QBS10901.1 3-dehydroquinate synthase [Legionella israelensis]SCX80200.1 3-dehydroquinate synthase [Legionella israelensis DSM 19235]STX57889.1 3-dehydroquinate synthase [Legionella israelensis]
MAKFDITHRIDVDLEGSSYPILITTKGLQDVDLLRQYVVSTQALIVTNEMVAPLYLSLLQKALVDVQCDVVILKDGEQYKNQQSLNIIYDALIEKKHHRDTTLIALGGGVIGDITGFAAATYQRGVFFIQIPTTLLAQVDASVGGKTAINHPLGKNLIGSFYQPSAVLIDIATLKTLPAREFRAGLAEVIKYALLSGDAFFDDLSRLLRKGLTTENMESLGNLIAECCKIKVRFVEQDEKEREIRALLNLGHTFAHALEAQTKYQRWLHGEAVAIGLYCASLLSCQLGYATYDFLKQLEDMLINAGLPHKIPKDIHLTELCEMMSLDKKIKYNKLQFVLVKSPGNCFLFSEVTEKQLNQALKAAVQGE